MFFLGGWTTLFVLLFHSLFVGSRLMSSYRPLALWTLALPHLNASHPQVPFALGSHFTIVHQGFNHCHGHAKILQPNFQNLSIMLKKKKKNLFFY